MLNDDDLLPLVGMEFGSEAAAHRAAERLKRSPAPVSLDVVPADAPLDAEEMASVGILHDADVEWLKRNWLQY